MILGTLWLFNKLGSCLCKSPTIWGVYKGPVVLETFLLPLHTTPPRRFEPSYRKLAKMVEDFCRFLMTAKTLQLERVETGRGSKEVCRKGDLA